MSPPHGPIDADACRALAYSPSGARVRCRLVTAFASDMVSVHDLDEGFTCRYVSPAAKRLFGYDVDELVGVRALDLVHPEDVSKVEEAAVLLRKSSDVGSATYRLRTSGGAYEWVESTCRVVPDPITGEPAELIATTRSAEARIAAEAEQARLLREAGIARAAAETANRTKDEFLAMMSHEFRTPLNAIAGHVDILQLGLHGPLTDAQRHALERVDLAQRYLLRLVNDILNVERLKAGRLEYDLQPVLLADLLHELEPMVEPQLRARSITYRVDVGPDDVVMADREKLMQVLINLISNAVKFTPHGGAVTIDSPRRAEESMPAGQCFIRVSDTGVGIPEGKQSSVFEPFVQVDASPSRRATGAGLGLSISRDLARGMCGQLRVRSAVGAGAAFTVTLPRATPSCGEPVP